MDNPEHAAEVLMQMVREHHFMNARQCDVETSIEFLENLQSLISMELDGLNETKRNQEGE